MDLAFTIVRKLDIPTFALSVLIPSPYHRDTYNRSTTFLRVLTSYIHTTHCTSHLCITIYLFFLYIPRIEQPETSFDVSTFDSSQASTF